MFSDKGWVPPFIRRFLGAILFLEVIALLRFLFERASTAPSPADQVSKPFPMALSEVEGIREVLSPKNLVKPSNRRQWKRGKIARRPIIKTVKNKNQEVESEDEEFSDDNLEVETPNKKAQNEQKEVESNDEEVSDDNPEVERVVTPNKEAQNEIQEVKNDVSQVDVQSINSQSDLESLLRSHPGSKEERQTYIWDLGRKMVQSWNDRYCDSPRKDPNMQFVPMAASNPDHSDRPLFLPHCNCDWNSESKGIQRDITPVPAMFTGNCLNIDGVFATNPFYPNERVGAFYNYLGGFQFSISFLQRFMALPTEIRSVIYELVVFQWAPNMRYPVTNPENFRIWPYHGIARKSTHPSFPPLESDAPHGSPEEKRYSDLSFHLKHKAGILDYLKEEEYRNLEALCAALAIFEGRTYHTKGINVIKINGEHHDLQRERQRALGVLNDLMEWFWDNAVVDLSSSINRASYRDADRREGGRDIIIPAKMRKQMYRPREQVHEKPCEHVGHHRWISHVTFTTKPAHAHRRSGPTIQQEFRGVMDLCDYIKLNLPFLRTIRAFIRLGPAQARRIVKAEGNLPWLRYIRDIPALDKFDFHVLVENPPSFEDKMEAVSTLTLVELTDRVTEIVELWKPKVSM